MAGIFKAYDIRGIYGESLTDEMAFKIGRALAQYLEADKIVIGYDMRPHSKPLFEKLAEGICLQGVDVVDIGLVSTPMCYYANGKLEADGSVIITASHNPGEWNGFKLCRKNAVPLSGPNGIEDIEQIVKTENFDEPAAEKGALEKIDIKTEYVEHIRKFAKIDKPLKVAVDCANSMGIAEGSVFEGLFETESIFDDYDGTFPNHEANPLKLDTLSALQEMVRAGDFDFGIAFDGDADRAGFVDEKGDIIPMDYISALIAEAVLEQNEGGNVFYDLRSSWAVKEIIEEAGGKALMSRVGHAFIKKQMRDEDAVFAGELSGHYYFRENYYAESSSLAAIFVANLVSETGRKLSELIEPIRRYVASGEINSTVKDFDVVFDRMRAQYGDARIIELDGLSFEFEDWWFNVRCSNTEPLMRLNLEADSKEKMELKRDEVLDLIRQ